MATNFEKIRQFKGKVANKWAAPTNYRRWVAGANKLLKTYYRVKNSGLLYPDLVQKIQEASDAWMKLGDQRYREKIDEQYYVEFDEVKNFNVVSFLAFQKNIHKLLGDDKVETFVEEERVEKVGSHCHLCKVQLKKPAYIVHRLASEELFRSEAIGIMCLHAVCGKLQKVIDLPELNNLIEDVKEVVKETDVNTTVVL